MLETTALTALVILLIGFSAVVMTVIALCASVLVSHITTSQPPKAYDPNKVRKAKISSFKRDGSSAFRREIEPPAEMPAPEPPQPDLITIEREAREWWINSLTTEDAAGPNEIAKKYDISVNVAKTWINSWMNNSRPVVSDGSSVLR